MPRSVYLNNKLVPEKEAMISVFDRSYLYGEGVFETLRTYNGHIAFSDLHYERLEKNCARLNIELPLNRHSFEKAILKTINANKIKDAYVRVTISPVGASFGIKKPKKMTTNVTIFCKEFSGRPKELYTKGARVLIIKDIPSDHPIMANLKSTNYLNKMMARDQAVQANADEGLFCTPEGKILEGSSTNIFIIKEGKVLTTPIAEGVLPGVTRHIVMQLAESQDIDISERTIDIEDLKSCDEVFLTGSTTEVLPVHELIDLAEKTKAPGPVTEKIMEAYKGLLP